MRMAGVVSRTHRQGLLSTGIGKLFGDFCNRRKGSGCQPWRSGVLRTQFQKPTRFQTRKGWEGDLTGDCISSERQLKRAEFRVSLELSQAGMPVMPGLFPSGSCLCFAKDTSFRPSQQAA